MQRFVKWIVLSTVAWCGVCSTVTATEPDLSPVLTKDVVGLVYWSGGDGWEAYQKTASYRAFYESGLVPTLTKHVERMPWRQYLTLIQSESGTSFRPEDVEAVVSQFWQHGVTAAFGIQEREIPAPYGLVILRGSAERFALLKQLATTHLADNAKEVEVAGRMLLRLVDDEQAMEVHIWSEGSDLVLFVTSGDESRRAQVERLLTAAPADRLVLQTQWIESWGDEPVPTDSFRAWANVAHLVKTISQFPEVQAVKNELAGYVKVAQWTGIDQWQTLAYRSGCHGDHVISEWSLHSNKPPMQWAGWGERTVSLADLPPLPARMTSFSLQVIDGAKVNHLLDEWGQQLINNPEQIVQFLSDLGLPGATVNTTTPPDAKTRQHIQKAMGALGSAVCIYQDRQQHVLPWGVPTVAIQVKDKDALIVELDSLKESGWKRDDRWGCPTYYRDSAFPVAKPIGEDVPDSPEFNFNASLGSTTIAVCDGWLVIGIQPQLVQTFVLRSQGKLPRWSADQLPAATREKLPAEFSRLSFSDPRASVAFLGSIAPWMGDGLRTIESTLNLTMHLQQTMIQQAANSDPEASVPPVVIVPAIDMGPAPSPLDIPPVEVMNAQLFPNVSVTTLEGNTVRERTYGSTFVDRPIFWGIGGYMLLCVGAISIN